MTNNSIIRLERESDYHIVENLTREAFWNVYQPGCTEHYVLHCYRSNPDFIPELVFVMETDGRHIPILTFGPISISPEFKRKGYGITLLRHAGFVLASSLHIHYHAEPRKSWFFQGNFKPR